MNITVYATKLLPDYPRIVTNVRGYLANVSRETFDVKTLNVGELDLSLTFPLSYTNDPRRFNYADVGGKLYFLTDWRKVTANACTCTAIFDHIHNYESIPVTGNLVAAHDLADVMYDDIIAKQIPIQVARTFGISYPVDPIAGPAVHSFLYAQDENPVDVSVVCKLTILQGQIERDVIIFSPPYHINNEGASIVATIGNYGRATALSNNEIKSVNEMYIIPWPFIRVPSETNATISVGGDGTQSVGVYWATSQYIQSAFLGTGGVLRLISYPNGDIVPLALTVGNLGSFSNLNLRSLYPNPTLTFRFDGSTGNIDFVLYNDGERIDLLRSVSVPFSALRINERELSRKISNAVSIASSALAVAGGAISGNPLAVAAGVTGVAQTVGGIITRTHGVQTAVDGQAFINCKWSPHLQTGGLEYVNCCGIIGHEILNSAEFTLAMRQNGYVGNWHVDDFDILQKRQFSSVAATWDGYSFEYNGTFRKFADNDALEVGASIPVDSRAVIRDVLTRGVTVHYDTIEPLKINWWAHPNTANV